MLMSQVIISSDKPSNQFGSSTGSQAPRSFTCTCSWSFTRKRSVRKRLFYLLLLFLHEKHFTRKKGCQCAKKELTCDAQLGWNGKWSSPPTWLWEVHKSQVGPPFFTPHCLKRCDLLVLLINLSTDGIHICNDGNLQHTLCYDFNFTSLPLSQESSNSILVEK